MILRHELFEYKLGLVPDSDAIHGPSYWRSCSASFDSVGHFGPNSICGTPSRSVDHIINSLAPSSLGARLMYLTFPEDQYRQAWNAAIMLARELKREVGLERGKEYNSTVYRVFPVPGEKFRFGHEARCQIVSPNEPLLKIRRRPIKGL